MCASLSLPLRSVSTSTRINMNMKMNLRMNMNMNMNMNIGMAASNQNSKAVHMLCVANTRSMSGALSSSSSASSSGNVVITRGTGKSSRMTRYAASSSQMMRCSDRRLIVDSIRSGNNTTTTTTMSHKRSSLSRCYSAKLDDGSGGSIGNNGNNNNNNNTKHTGESDDENDSGKNESSTVAAASAGASASMFERYNQYCIDNPIAAKSVSAATLNFVGDAICQLFFSDSTEFDFKRSMIFTLLGGLLVGPSLHFHYLNLDRLFPPPASLTSSVGKLVVDQFMFSPVFIAVFFAALLTLEGKSPEMVGATIKQDLRSAVISNWKLWIPFQLLNFRLVPQQLQVLSANLFSVIWNIYLSFATHKSVTSKTVDSK